MVSVLSASPGGFTHRCSIFSDGLCVVSGIGCFLSRLKSDRRLPSSESPEPLRKYAWNLVLRNR